MARKKKQPSHKLVGLQVVDTRGSSVGVVEAVYEGVRKNTPLLISVRINRKKLRLIPVGAVKPEGDQLRLNVTVETVEKSPSGIVRRNRIAPVHVRRVYKHYDKSLPKEYERSVPRTVKAHNGSNLGPMRKGSR